MQISGTTTETGTATTSKRVATGSRRSEDWMAVLLGFLVIGAVLTVFHWKIADLRDIVSTYRWTTDVQIASLNCQRGTIERSAECRRVEQGSEGSARKQGPQGHRSSRRQDGGARQPDGGRGTRY
jgi:hypothetical protein